MKQLLGLFLGVFLVALCLPTPVQATGFDFVRPNLFIVAIGINEYKNPSYQLRSARSDAQEFANTVERAGKHAFGKISKQVLLDAAATSGAIEAAFNKIALEAKPNDVFVFHFSGQGSQGSAKEPSAKDFYLVTSEIENIHEAEELQKGISATKLSAWCAKLPARNQLIILDANNSGSAFEKFAGRIVGENKEIAQLSGRNIVVLGVDDNAFDSFTYQGKRIDHGVLTYALLLALSGESDLDKDGRLSVRRVQALFHCKVPQLTWEMGQIVQPKSYSTGQDFPLASFPKSPQEAKAEEEKLRTATRVTNASKEQATNVEPGTNYALFFATDKYDDSKFETLNNPLRDANAIAESLKTYYGFETRVVPNPTLKEIIAVIREYQKKAYKPADHLFIFFAGHGTFDDVGKSGYLVARDSKADDDEHITYYPYTSLKDAVDGIGCEHIFLALDVCFGGTFIQEVAKNSGGKYRIVPDTETARMSLSELIRRKVDKRTRKILCSGASEVFDGKPGEHSPFAKYFLDVLETYGGKEGYLTFEDIYKSVERTKPGPIADNFGSWAAGSNFFFVASRKD